MAGSSQKKWPPIAAAVIALVLVFLVLPNPLRIPQNNPTAAAEYAPVPGRQESAQNANFGETGEAGSPGIGAGGVSGGAAVLPPTQALPPPQFRPREKDCVGNPPRQTEDPLSPPCVPFFQGDNGGRTWVGITKDEIKVILYNDESVEGDMNKPWKPSDEHTCSSTYECEFLVRTIKAQLRYFQSRYQTYGRTVHLIAKSSSDGLTTTCDGRQTDAEQTQQELRPFAVMFFGEGGQCYNERMAQFKVPSFGIDFDLPRKDYENYRPYIWGFFPDQETQQQWSASFICRRLVGQTAKYSGDVLLQGQKRKFALIYPVNSVRGPTMHDEAMLLQKYVKDICGVNFDYSDPYDASGAGAGSSEAPGLMAKYKRARVTTLICYCVPVQTELTVSSMQNTANALGYYPEWYWDQASSMDRAVWDQQYTTPTQHGFGVTYFWRSPAFRQQHHYQAYLTQEPGTRPNVRFNFSLYHMFLNLFEAIQAAGPQLTPDSVERGMFTFNFLNRADYYEPIGGYGPYDAKAVATFNFVDTAMAWWYDPTGTPPGGQRNSGCIRVVDGGRRYYWNEWPRGDAGLRSTSSPCSEDTRKLSDPGQSGTV
jgi:hypothetical protein